MFGDDYGGALGAVPYAVRHSDSWLFRAYAALAALLAVFVSVSMVLALVVLFGETAEFQGGSLTLSRAFYGVVALLVLFPLLGPVLAVARRHRRRAERGADPPDPRDDAALALTGFLFVASLYAMLLTSIPASLREPPAAAGALEPLVAALYETPSLAGLLFPLGAAAVMAFVWARGR
jgi:hypothetical protein